MGTNLATGCDVTMICATIVAMRPLIVIEGEDDDLFRSTVAEVIAAGWNHVNGFDLNRNGGK